ncbi:MAG: glycosyltransferase [Cyanobacteria bacterium P01_A01_bin.37]
MDITVILPCFNAAKTISAQLDALSEADCSESWELLIVDNGSTDSTLEVVKKYQQSFQYLEIIEALDKKGSGYVRNVGVNHAKASKILFCDADDRVSENWLKVMSAALDSHEFIAGGLTLEHINELWRVPKQTPFGTKDKPQEDVFSSRFDPDIRYAPACNMGIRKNVHVAVGGFDESIPFNVDYDYCWKVSLAGYRLTFISEGLIEYRLRHDLKGTYKQRYNWGKWGVFIYRKHIGKGKLIDRAKFILGGWRHLPALILKVRCKSDVFELIAWMGGRMGEVDGCCRFLISD